MNGALSERGKCLLTGCVAVGIELIKCSLIHSVLPSSAAPWHRSIIIQMGENALDAGPQRLNTFYDWDRMQLVVLVGKLKIKNAFCAQWLWRGSHSHEQWMPQEKILILTSCSVVCLAWLNVKGPMKCLQTSVTMWCDAAWNRKLVSSGGRSVHSLLNVKEATPPSTAGSDSGGI